MGTGTEKVPEPGIFHISGGIGTGIGNIWYRKKVSEPVSEKFSTGKDFRRQNFGILKIYNGYRYRNREFFIFSGGIGTGIGKIWYRKKVSEPVSEKFGTEKSTGIRIENIWYRKKVLVSVSFNILGTVTHCILAPVNCILCLFDRVPNPMFDCFCFWPHLFILLHNCIPSSLIWSPLMGEL